VNAASGVSLTFLDCSKFGSGRGLDGCFASSPYLRLKVAILHDDLRELAVDHLVFQKLVEESGEASLDVNFLRSFPPSVAHT
jgi:hypothetical protein